MDSRPAATPGSSQEYEHNESPTAAAEPPAVAEKRILKQSIPSVSPQPTASSSDHPEQSSKESIMVARSLPDHDRLTTSSSDHPEWTSKESIPTVRSLSDHGQPTALSPDHPALSETLGVPNESIILHSVPPQRDTTLPSTAEQSAFADVIGIQSHATPQQSVKNARIERPGEAVDDTSALSPVVRNISHSADHPLPGSNASDEPRPLPRARTIDRDLGRYPSAIDWIVPVEEKAPAKSKFLTIGERLEPTLIKAQFERNKYSVKAKVTGYSLNAAIGLQVLLGSLTTGVAAAASSGRQAAVATTVLGALSTIVASYLARARGSNEPELSITRVKDLEQFIREIESFQMDHVHVATTEFDYQLVKFRERFEELLGNGNGERKLSPPV